MNCFILDEWFWHDLMGDNMKTKQNETMQFLLTIIKKCDVLICAKPSGFNKKEIEFYKLANTSNNPLFKNIFKIWRSIRLDSQKYKEFEIKNEQNVPVGIKEDDKYLWNLYMINRDCIIITTDNDLIKILNDLNVKCEHRDKFLKEYLAD